MRRVGECHLYGIYRYCAREVRPRCVLLSRCITWARGIANIRYRKGANKYGFRCSRCWDLGYQCSFQVERDDELAATAATQPSAAAAATIASLEERVESLEDEVESLEDENAELKLRLSAYEAVDF